MNYHSQIRINVETMNCQATVTSRRLSLVSRVASLTLRLCKMYLSVQFTSETATRDFEILIYISRSMVPANACIKQTRPFKTTKRATAKRTEWRCCVTHDGLQSDTQRNAPRNEVCRRGIRYPYVCTYDTSAHTPGRYFTR